MNPKHGFVLSEQDLDVLKGGPIRPAWNGDSLDEHTVRHVQSALSAFVTFFQKKQGRLRLKRSIRETGSLALMMDQMKSEHPLQTALIAQTGWTETKLTPIPLAQLVQNTKPCHGFLIFENGLMAPFTSQNKTVTPIALPFLNTRQIYKTSQNQKDTQAWSQWRWPTGPSFEKLVQNIAQQDTHHTITTHWTRIARHNKTSVPREILNDLDNWKRWAFNLWTKTDLNQQSCNILSGRLHADGRVDTRCHLTLHNPDGPKPRGWEENLRILEDRFQTLLPKSLSRVDTMRPLTSLGRLWNIFPPFCVAAHTPLGLPQDAPEHKQTWSQHEKLHILKNNPFIQASENLISPP